MTVRTRAAAVATAALVAAGIGLTGSAAAAEGGPMDKKTFLEALSSGGDGAEKLLRLHFRGLIEGLEAANAALRRRGDTSLYCLPLGMIVQPQWLIDATKRYYDRYDNIPEAMPVAAVATIVLQDAYPCPTATANPEHGEVR
ncbi:MAG: hypothetical protein CMM50_02510 [Rhodospirillaceae bacterium]|nr:hypothetical protein [Rhodospirillaceae bacterium]